ncbi:MAG TPA: Ig domain-containing protein [Candidatus Binatia bacterium]|nr:Ig domain-containing protein [Candidatus Binatia bacterium]
MNIHFLIRPMLLVGLLAGASSVLLSQQSRDGTAAESMGVPAAGQRGIGESDLIIENDSELPDTYPHAAYEVRFRARGGVPLLHWRVEKGILPPGLKLDDDGLLHGSPNQTGEFQFTVSVTDRGQPQQSVQKVFTIRVFSAILLNWKTPAHVNGSRIEGSVDVSNTTRDDIDLTFIVLAVPGNGRAVAIGYQHFVLRRGTLAQELPFGETLPRGGYVVHVDTVGEVASRNVIYRERLQTPSMLQVAVGP